MRRQFLRNSNQGLLTRGRVIVGGALLILLLGFLVRTFAPDVFIAAARPLWSAGSMMSAAVGSAVSFESKESVTKERDRLKVEVTALENENAVLRARLTDLGKLGETNGITAGVLVRPPVSPYDTLVVEAGSKKGVRVGASAYGPGGVPLGKVELVSPEHAHVALYSSANRTTEGWVGEGRLPISLVGAGGGSFRATVAKDAAIAIGEEVFIPGPGALPIGTVARVDVNPSSPTAYVYVRPRVNPFTVTWITIDAPEL